MTSTKDQVKMTPSSFVKHFSNMSSKQPSWASSTSKMIFKQQMQWIF
jgi:hypothetical protein